METLLSSSYRGSEKGSNECPLPEKETGPEEPQPVLAGTGVLVGGGSGSAGSLSGRSLSRPLGWPQHVLDRALSHTLGQALVCPSAQRGKQGRGYHAHFTGEETEPGEWKRLTEISPN